MSGGHSLESDAAIVQAEAANALGELCQQACGIAVVTKMGIDFESVISLFVVFLRLSENLSA